MRCLACDKNLSDREANRKYPEPEKIKNPEERYIGLCDGCLVQTDLVDVVPEEIIISGETDEEQLNE